MSIFVSFLGVFGEFLKSLQTWLGIAPNGVRSAFCQCLAVPVAQIIVQIGGLEAEI